MGVLDEAIREHLELKRKHGASPEEVKRQQDEALGPARREAPPEESEQAADDEAPVAEPVEAVEPAATDAPVAADIGEPTRVMEQPPPDELQDPDPPHGDALLHPEGGEPLHAADTHAQVDPEAPAQAPPPDAEEPAADRPAGEEGEGEDVLEETPDFLQETPEHDRLWFEQKPPRDFDFD